LHAARERSAAGAQARGWCASWPKRAWGLEPARAPPSRAARRPGGGQFPGQAWEQRQQQRQQRQQQQRRRRRHGAL